MDYKEKIIALLNSQELSKEQKEKLESIFPELKESEEERMRKGLIEYFLHYPDHEITYYGLKSDSVIAWLEKQGEQKPVEWSEEDELHIRELESLVKRVWVIAEHENDKDTIHKMSDLSFFLKTLKPQPKQEWSEEEKARIDKIVDVLDWAEEKGYIRYSDWEDYVCYVKSLRPQNTWKPSDEQIIELRRVISGCSYDIEPLTEMEEQLKKLRGE